MAVSRGREAVIAAGPTELKRYLPLSLIATALVAGVPLWLVFGLGERLGVLATIVSIIASFTLAHIGAIAWTRWPGSRDVVFNDLMLWGFVRRIVTQRRLIRRVERLGFSVTNDPDEMTIQERTDLLKKLAAGLEAGDPYTHGHSQRVARHAYMVAKGMKLSRRETEKIRLAGVIHDVGKLRIPRDVITKPGKLTDEEFDVIKLHTVDGAAMVEVLRDPELTDMVRHHHERLDGSGYPDNLAGDDISIGARVLAVADTFDAASSLRPYRAARKHKVALDILTQEARAGRLDPVVVDAFIRYYSGRRALRWWALLSSGPAHLFDLPFAFVQRLGATGLANAAIVGVTAVALAPGSPLHRGRLDHDAQRKDRVVATNARERNARDTTAIINSASAAARSSSAEGGSNQVARREGPTKGKAGPNEKAKNKGSNRNNGSPPANAGQKGKGPREDPGQGQGEASGAAGGVVAGAIDANNGVAAEAVTGRANDNAPVPAENTAEEVRSSTAGTAADNAEDKK